MLGFSFRVLGKFTFLKHFASKKAIKIGIDFEVAEKKKNLCIVNASGSGYHLFTESLIFGVKKRGHEISFIIDDNTLPIHS